MIAPEDENQYFAGLDEECLTDTPGRPRGKTNKSDTGDPLHTQEPVTVASFRTWRGWRERVARDRCLTCSILTSTFREARQVRSCASDERR